MLVRVGMVGLGVLCAGLPCRAAAAVACALLLGGPPARAQGPTAPSQCARASFPSAATVHYVNECGFAVVFVTTCAVGAERCYGKGEQVVAAHSAATVTLAGGPFRISQPERAE